MFGRLSYKTRNTIVLAVLLTTVSLVGGYFTFIHYPGKINKIDKEITELDRQIKELEFVGTYLAETNREIKREEIRLANIDKQIVNEVSPATTYHYLNQILAYSGFLKFDMLYKGSEKKKSYIQNVYNIKGEGDFSAIYKFISYLEKGPQIYKVRKINLRGVEGVDLETGNYEFIVTFEMEVLALYTKKEVDIPEINRRLGDRRIASIRNPFYPAIKKNLPPNFYDLLEVERAELKAIMPHKAFVIDHNRKTHILEEGDEVYLGYVKKIDEKNNRIIFTLDKGGIIEDFALELRFGEIQEERE